MSRFIPTAQERRLIAALAMMPERQVLRAYRDPEHRAVGNLERVRRAAAEIGIRAPEATPTQPLQETT